MNLQERPYRVYIAGPINGSGNIVQNQEKALYFASKLRHVGACPFVPHLFLDWDNYKRREDTNNLLNSYREPMSSSDYFQPMDDIWLSLCDAMVIIPGKSPGVDHERELAQKLGIPIFEQIANDGAAAGPWDAGLTKVLAAMQSRKLHKRDTDADSFNELMASQREVTSLKTALREASKNKTLANYQQRVTQWLSKQPFGASNLDAVEPLLGIQEEAGELCHAFLKGRQKIRYTPEQVKAKKIDAVGDIMVYLAGYCVAEGFSLEECFETALAEIEKRDWSKHPITGKKVVIGPCICDDDIEPTPYDEQSAK